MSAAQWAGALANYAQHATASGQAPATVGKRGEHLRRFVEWCDVGPWQVQPTHLDAYALELARAGLADNTRRVHLSTLRAFYRWATGAGLVREDPTRLVGHRALRKDEPEQWRQPIAAYRTYLRATGRSEETVRTRVNAVRRFSRDMRHLEPEQVTLDELAEWFGGKRWATETRKLHRDALRSFYSWAVNSGRMSSSPAESLPPIRAAAPVPRPASEDAYRLALAKAGPRERLGLRFAAEVGLRRGEIVRIHSRDLERIATSSGYGWTLRVHGKGGKVRLVPLSRDLAGAALARGEGYLFPGGDNGHLSAQWLGKILGDLLPDGVTLHALRHRFATLAYGIDRDVFTVQALLGHASPATTHRYVQVADDTRRALVERVAALGELRSA